MEVPPNYVENLASLQVWEQSLQALGLEVCGSLSRSCYLSYFYVVQAVRGLAVSQLLSGRVELGSRAAFAQLGLLDSGTLMTAQSPVAWRLFRLSSEQDLGAADRR